MLFLRHTLFALSTCAALLANPNASQDETLASVIATGEKASSELLKTLGGQLKSHMKSGGPVDAANFCAQSAYPLTDSVAQSFGKEVQIKRVSLKYRNPANAPQADEKVVLESLENLQNEGVILPQELVKKVDNDTYKYFKPLMINNEVCLKCHGVIENDALKKTIGAHYPEDKAIGYRMGDLRGAIVVTIKK